MEMKPIGLMKSVFLYKNGTPRQSSVCPLARGTITIDKTIFNNPQHAIEDLREYSHIWIIFVFHQNNNDHFKAKVRPPRLGGKRLGVFSTRSPYRPNPIGLSLAKLDKVIGSTLYVSGIDILNGTPILDIKPYIPDYDQPKVDSDASLDQEIYQDVLVDTDKTKCSGTSDLENGFPIIKGNTCHDALSDDSNIIDDCFGFVNTHAKNNSSHRNNISEENCDISSLNLEFSPSRNMVGHAPKISELSVCSLIEDSDTRERNISKTNSSGKNPANEVHKTRQIHSSMNEKARRTFAPIMSEMELTSLDVPKDKAIETLKPLFDCKNMSKSAMDLSFTAEKSVPMAGEITPDSIRNSLHKRSDANSLTTADECAWNNTCEKANTACLESNGIAKNECIFKTDNSAWETAANSGNKPHHDSCKFNLCSSVFSSVKGGELENVTSSKEHLQICLKNSNIEIQDYDEVKTATWLKTSENSKLAVRFTPNSSNQLHKFSQMPSDKDFFLKFFKNSGELKEAIQDILKGDPRSIYRKTSCKDSLYYFTLDTAHVTCWFDDDNCVAEVLRVQPISQSKFESHKQS